MTNITNTRIVSVGQHLPSEIIKSDDLLTEINTERLYDIPHDWISRTMGIVERRAAPTGSKPSDLAIPAALEAIDDSGVNPDHIDLVIFCGIERDNPEPATAHIIQNKLGLQAPYAFDVANACMGFFDGMHLASTLVKAGTVRYALVTTGEVSMRLLRFFQNKLKQGVPIKEARNIIGALSVGDAGGAVILGPSHDEVGFRLFNMATASQHYNKCIYEHKDDGSLAGQMLMGQISSAIVNTHKHIVLDTLEKLGWNEFDVVLSHQMGQRPFDRLAELPGIGKDRMVKTFHKLGNITTATFPVNFYKASKSGRVTPGCKIGSFFAGSGLGVVQSGYKA